MMKKAQGMSMKVIIVAVIALIVLVVLVLIFTGKTKFFGKQTAETSAQFTGNRCAIPGTTNECLDKTTSERQGGSWSPGGAEGYADCHSQGCCSF